MKRVGRWMQLTPTGIYTHHFRQRRSPHQGRLSDEEYNIEISDRFSERLQDTEFPARSLPAQVWRDSYPAAIRPNPVKSINALDGTPVLDIKPYSADIEYINDETCFLLFFPHLYGIMGITDESARIYFSGGIP